MFGLGKRRDDDYGPVFNVPMADPEDGLVWLAAEDDVETFEQDGWTRVEQEPPVEEDKPWWRLW